MILVKCGPTSTFSILEWSCHFGSSMRMRINPWKGNIDVTMVQRGLDTPTVHINDTILASLRFGRELRMDDDLC